MNFKVGIVTIPHLPLTYILTAENIERTQNFTYKFCAKFNTK